MSQTSSVIKKVRWWDFLTALLIVAAVFTAVGRLIVTQWTEDLDLVFTVTLIGVVLGLALGQSIFSRPIVFLFTVAYGICVIPWQLGLTFGKDIQWTERLLSMQGRLVLIVRNLINREPITDNLLFIFLMAVLFWVLSIHAGYTVTRYANSWLAVLPAGLATFVIQTFDPLIVRRSWYLAFYLFFALLLVARLTYLKNQEKWKSWHAYTPPDAGFDITRYAAVVATLFILLAWNVPVLAESFRPVSEAWRVVNRPWVAFKDRLSFAFAALQASVGLVSDQYGESLALGRGTPLSEKIVLEVEAPNYPYVGARYYWRARTYDFYKMGQWEATINDKQTVTSNTPNLLQPGADQRVSATFTFYPYDVLSLLYVVPQPLWVSRPAAAAMTNNPDGTVDLSSYEAVELIRPGEQYKERSSLSSLTETQLRRAGTYYPQWVVDRYLQLPDEITPRTRQLAQQIAAGWDNPYDIVKAVTIYLRTNIAYRPTLPEPPARQERIDWFLFDIKQGFCNYYASAEVVLLRSLGIPARMAVGYAQGERVDTTDQTLTPGNSEAPGSAITPATFVVRQKDAHAWPEVYFPGVGWVEFEPTASQDPISRPIGSNASDQTVRPDENSRNPLGTQIPPQDRQMENNTLPPSQGAGQANRAGTLLRMGLILVFLGLILLLYWQVQWGFQLLPYIDRLSVQIPVRMEKALRVVGLNPPGFLRRWVAYASLPPISRSYLEINRALHRLGESPKQNQTPAERVNNLAEVLPLASQPSNLLLTEYHTATYSLHPADAEVAYQAGTEVRRLSYQEKFQRWLASIRKLLHISG